MAVTIGALKYDIIADTEQFERASTATRDELRQSSRLMREAQTPAEKYGDKLDRLNDLRRKGLIDARAYGTAVKKNADAMKRANREATTLGKSYNRVGDAIKGYGASLAGLGLGAMAIRGIKDEMENIDQTAKFARLLNISIEQLQGFRFAGEQTAGMLEGQVDTALQRLQRRLGQAVQGTGEAKKVLEQLGLEATDLINVPLDQAFRRISEEMAGIGSQQEKLALAMVLFDTEGVKMLQLMENRAAAVADGIRQATEAGEMFGSEAAAEIEKLNDALDKLDKRKSSFFKNWALFLANPKKALSDPSYLGGGSQAGSSDVIGGIKGDPESEPLLTGLGGLIEGQGGNNASRRMKLNEEIARNQAEANKYLKPFHPELRDGVTEITTQQSTTNDILTNMLQAITNQATGGASGGNGPTLEAI